jgi:hypothetical protein
MLERLRELLFGLGVTAVAWPQPAEDWDEHEPPVMTFDCTGDDPGPERIVGCELRPL